ncbi:glycoside hydrolase [Boudabousia tangfeifanii]|uniref:Glycoside hydrolase n=1 Tax=Boudabousia tangfeifanii TaxID=1912795 RepID=A0A1D9MML6_9ACTO|nr:glycoside hydrolase family 31 protein [Boudabousia tangfeifanii]AOZ73534.1 glycoside hydrolase [Boudabousia tangfeifanii]
MTDGSTVKRSSEVSLELLAGERWWGGAVDDAAMQPYGDQNFSRDLAVSKPSEDGIGAPSNQAAPILVSTHGRSVSSDRPFRFEFADGVLHVWGQDLRVVDEARTLAGAYQDLAAQVWSPSGSPARAMFAGPQYNTWIEMPHRPTQEKVLAYVRNLLDCGMPPGVVMIDDMWARDYGTWEFDLSAFPDPAQMVRTLHEWGCAVMLWVVPFVSPDSWLSRQLRKQGFLLLDEDGQVALRPWWNGFSACLDLSNPEAVAWLKGQLDTLRNDFGVDGFKFDAGDVRDYRVADQARGLEPVDMCQAWAEVGLDYEFNEYRACWKMAGAPLAQRLQDKPPTWDGTGIGALIPEMLVQAMIGLSFTCPDMIGGGEIEAMTRAGGIDQELFVRYAQVAALTPMMQFSVSPARVLDEAHFQALRVALGMRERYLPLLLDLVERSGCDGTPLMRPVSYLGAEDGGSLSDVVAQCRDQFLLGDDLLVAPVLEPGATSRRVVLPAGRWRDVASGEVHAGEQVVEVPVSLETLPVFERA